ncbi:MAG TPA: hypothetical protein VHW45_03060 [Candidatus Sulfotelmatobacter sp.]|nr:hypothetical protein [Candidatus Sulfotelmatobacter sp.]
MTNETLSPFAMTNNLKRSFEHAVRDMYEVGATGKISSYRSPIGRRRKAAEPSANAEKRALSDAARALAQLWKVAPYSR